VDRQDGAPSNIGCSDLSSVGKLFGKTGNGGSLTYSIDSTKYRTGSYAPGIYVVTVKGTVVNSSSTPKRSETTTYKITLLDPCSPPVSVTAAALANQEYTITDNTKYYTHPVFSISPSYCPLTYTYDIADI